MSAELRGDRRQEKNKEAAYKQRTFTQSIEYRKEVHIRRVCGIPGKFSQMSF
jgi:hypothetical protein